MTERDLYQQLDELLAAKSYDELSNVDLQLLSELGYDAEMYTLLYHQRKLPNPPFDNPVFNAELRNAVRAKRKPSMLTYPIPAWQAAAALALWLGIQTLIPRTPHEVVPPVVTPSIVYQTDTVLLEKIIKDTIRLIIQAPAIFPDTGSPAIAFDSLPKNSPRGITVKDRPELKRFFTETF